jgi:hypothetical protein
MQQTLNRMRIIWIKLQEMNSPEIYSTAMLKTKTKTFLIAGLLTVALIVFVSGSRSSKDDPFIDHLKNRLMQYNKDYPVERTYLLTDRFVYKPGEDLWFKGYVSTSGEHLEMKSEDFFVKLLNSKGEEIISRRYPLTGNQANGRLLIPRNSIPGRYWLVAFTGWMKNQCFEEAFRKEILISKYYDKRFQVDVVFGKTFYYSGDTLNAVITITDPNGKPMPAIDFDYEIGTFNRTETRGSGETDIKGSSRISCVVPGSTELLLMTVEVKSRKVSGDYSLLIPALTEPLELSFFPEGGRLVKGLYGIMAIKTTSVSGLPAKISGEILDHDGHRIKAFKTDESGNGTFEYIPQQDTCFAHILQPSGISRLYPLPMAEDSGMVIQCVEQGSDSVRFNISTSQEHARTTTYWIATVERNLVWSEVIQFTKSTRISIPVEHLRKGLMQVSVFDQHHDLVAERLLNLHNAPDQIVLKTDNKTYHSRQRVNVLLEFSGPGKQINMGMFVSLRQLADNPYLVDLKRITGSFTCDSAEKHRFLPVQMTDQELLTTSYRPLKWNDVMIQDALGSSYKRHDGITGKVYDKKDNLSQHAKVRVTHIPNYRSYETQTDETGTFHVGFGSDIIDFNYLNVDAYDALGKINLLATVDHDYVEKLRSLVTEDEESKDLQKYRDILAYGEPDLIFALRYGPGKFRKSMPDNKKKYDPNQYAGYSNVLDIIQDLRPYRLSNNSIVFTTENINNTGPSAQEGAIIVINGALKGNKIDILKNLQPSDITNINISTSLLDIHKYTTLNFQGVIEITTIQGMYKYRQPTIQLGMDILNTNRVFYSPDYSIESSTSSDNRKTLYWNPQFSLKSGQSAIISFYTSDIKGIFYGVAEGMDEEGNPVRAEFSFIVE